MGILIVFIILEVFQLVCTASQDIAFLLEAAIIVLVVSFVQLSLFAPLPVKVDIRLSIMRV